VVARSGKTGESSGLISVNRYISRRDFFEEIRTGALAAAVSVAIPNVTGKVTGVNPAGGAMARRIGGHGKRYEYKASAGGTKDLSWLPLGNSSGHLAAVETPAGLPIITGLRSPASDPNVVGGVTELKIDYLSGAGRRLDWSPWKICFSDSMQPVVGCRTATADYVAWPLDMKPVSRDWYSASNILRTVSRTDECELTVKDFIPTGLDMLIRIFTVRNVSLQPLAVRLFHYAPINAIGRKLYTWVKDRDYKATKPVNCCNYDAGHDILFFHAGPADNGAWIMGADTPSSGHQCSLSPETGLSISSGGLNGSDQAGPGVVDAAMSFDSPVLQAGQSFSVTVYLASVSPWQTDQAPERFRKVLNANPGNMLMERTTRSWNDWLKSGCIPKSGNTGLDSLVERLLVVLKACSWDTGGLPCDQGELTGFYFRDSLRPAHASVLYGFHEEAKRIILSLEAYAAKYGFNNSNPYDPSIKEVVEAGFNENTIFQDRKEFSVDDPALLVFTVGKIWEITHDRNFILQAWPFVRYAVGLARRDIGPLGAITQNSGFQDDMLNWAFPRGVDPYGSYPGVTCSYWNMVWVSALEHAAGIADELGRSEEKEELLRLAGQIRGVIENRFWNEELKQYAYFHDPRTRESYFERQSFTSVPDSSGGQFVFPDPPLPNGLTLLHWVGFARNRRSKLSYELARDRLFPLPEEPVASGVWNQSLCDRSHENHGASQSISYARLLNAAIKEGDLETAEILVEWLIRNVPLGGVPEMLPTGVRAVQFWPCGEVLIALHNYLRS
jgi:GH15 family glucan-1,4-alpha-glucosidase